MSVRSQMAFRPRPADDPWRASRIRKTFEITPTGAAPLLDFATRAMDVCVLDLSALATGGKTPAEWRSVMRDAVSTDRTLPRSLPKCECMVLSGETQFKKMKFFN